MLIAIILFCVAAAILMRVFFPHVGVFKGGFYVAGVVFAALVGLIMVAAP